MQGLLGIFGDRDNSKKNVKYYLWATNIFYLNDAAEFIYKCYDYLFPGHICHRGFLQQKLVAACSS